MLSPWFGASSAFSEMDTMRREMSALLHGLDYARVDDSSSPDVRMVEDDEAWRVQLDVPGLSADDIEVTVQSNRLTLVAAPEGYKAHRRERRTWRFSRSFRLPARVDADRVLAEFSEGVLTVSLPKTPEVEPRQIAVQAG